MRWRRRRRNAPSPPLLPLRLLLLENALAQTRLNRVIPRDLSCPPCCGPLPRTRRTTHRRCGSTNTRWGPPLHGL